jgi:hypothetical protein
LPAIQQVAKEGRKRFSGIGQASFLEADICSPVEKLSPAGEGRGKKTEKSAAQRANPNGIESSSPALMRSGYAGFIAPTISSTLKGLNVWD